MEYRDILQLMHHLQVWNGTDAKYKGMGENNAMRDRRNLISRVTLKEANELYKVTLHKDIHSLEVVSVGEWRDSRNL